MGVENPLSPDLSNAYEGVNVAALKAVKAQTGAHLNMRDEGDKLLAQIPMPFTRKSSESAGNEKPAGVGSRVKTSDASQLPDSRAPQWKEYSEMCRSVFGDMSSEAVSAGLRHSEEVFREGRFESACAAAETASAAIVSNPSTPAESVVSVLSWTGRCKEHASLLGDALERYRHALWRLQCEYGTGTVKQQHSVVEVQMQPDPADLPERYRLGDFDIHGFYAQAAKARTEAKRNLSPASI